MISCEQCIQRLKPDDPRIPQGRYHHSTCDYFCDKPQYYRDPKTQTVEHIVRHSDMSNKEYAELKEMKRKVAYLESAVRGREGDGF